MKEKLTVPMAECSAVLPQVPVMCQGQMEA